jgi:tRNA-Thr(GGU) m(6)t(6)A37 methyltransferase TsaA
MNRKGKVEFIGVVEKSGKVSRVKVFAKFCTGLQAIDRYSHVVILYWFHLRDNERERRTLQVTPKRHPGAPQVGVFASRSPSRPNPIGMCVAKVVRFENCVLSVEGLDAAEGTPVVDIKPYLPRSDSVPGARVPSWTLRGPKT